MGDLADTYHCLEKHADAEKLQIQVLDLRNKLLGQEHPDTISAICNLANTYHCLGNYAKAEKLQIQVLDLRNRCLGQEHPDTITAMVTLQIHIII